MTTRLALDHLVIAARTLAEGVDWCEATLGIRPSAGGQHVMMGTHNRVFDVSSARFPRSYAEIIAIDPSLPPPRRARWFDLDDPALQAQLQHGPRLVHWVARCDALDTARAAMLAAGANCGEVMQAERATPHGMLRWRITVRPDGRHTLGGAAPALIEWGERHPTDRIAASGVQLEAMQLGTTGNTLMAQMPAAVKQDPTPSAPAMCVVLNGPRGRVTLSSNAEKD